MNEHLTLDDLVDYLHKALPPETDAQIYSHLQQCEPCRLERDREAEIAEMLRAHAKREERELPATLKAAIWNEIRSAPSPALLLFRTWLRPALAVPALAVLAAAAYFGSSYLAPHGAPTIAAAYYLQNHEAMGRSLPFSDRGSFAPVEMQQSSASAPSNQIAIETALGSTTADGAP